MIIATYYTREILKISALIFLGLIGLYLSLRIGNSLDDAARGLIVPQHLFPIVALKMLISLKELVPISLFLGVFAATTKIKNNFEWSAMQSAGFSLNMLLKTIFKVSMIAGLLVGYITLYVTPETELQLRKLKEVTKDEATVGGIKPGRFTDFDEGSQVFYAEKSSADGKFLEEAFVERRLANESNVLKSDKAFIEYQRRTGDRFAVFENGISYKGTPGELSYITTEFNRYLLRIETGRVREFNSQIGFLPSSQLIKTDELLHRIELQWRIAPIICTILMPIVAALLAVFRIAGGWHFGLIVLISTYFIYANTLASGKALLGRGLGYPELGLWPAHLIPILFIICIAAYKSGGFNIGVITRP